MERNLSKIRCT